MPPEPQPDARMIEWLGFPEPPHRITDGQSGVRLAVGHVAVALLLLVGGSLLVGYFAFTNSGRALLADTALAAGLGRKVPEARVVLRDCDYAGSRPGARMPGQWRCQAFVELGSERTEVPFQTVTRSDDAQPAGVGRVFGRLGVYWPLGLLAARWWNASVILLIGFGLIALCVSMRGWIGDARALSRARHGRVRSADLLTWQGRPRFAYVDDFGTRRYGRALRAGLPLILDGVRTTGVALVRGRSAVLIDAGLRPLDLDSARRAAILERAGDIQRRCQVRSALPPRPGDATTLAGRIERIELALAKPATLAGAADSEALMRLYGDAWRLVWDSDDSGIADRALASRDAIADRLGPAATWSALQRCRTADATRAATAVT